MPLVWEEVRDTWPNAALSRFVDTRGHRWHIQRKGAGAGVLLLHGAGASTHSWRDLIGPLSAGADVMAVDLPGQGLSTVSASGRFGLPQMAEDIADLLTAEEFSPQVIVGHSAGAAIALQMVLSGAVRPARIIGINAALAPFDGLAGKVFPPLAKLMSLNPFIPRLFVATSTSARTVRNLIEGTGSKISDVGLALYRQLFANVGHADATLRMMANWSLEPLIARLDQIDVPVTLLIGGRDKAVAPDGTRRVAKALATVEIIDQPEAGHLLHEENPDATASLILKRLEQR